MSSIRESLRHGHIHRIYINFIFLPFFIQIKVHILKGKKFRKRTGRPPLSCQSKTPSMCWHSTEIISDRYRPDRNPVGQITVRYRFK